MRMSGLLMAAGVFAFAANAPEATDAPGRPAQRTSTDHEAAPVLPVFGLCAHTVTW